MDDSIQGTFFHKADKTEVQNILTLLQLLQHNLKTLLWKEDKNLFDANKHTKEVYFSYLYYIFHIAIIDWDMKLW